MHKITKHIEIVSSTDLSLSSMSDESRRAVQATLASRYTHVSITMVDDLGALKALVARKPDLVFLGMKFIPSTSDFGTDEPYKVWLASYLDRHDIAYTGSCWQSHELDLNKDLAKQQVQLSGLRTAKSFVARRVHQLAEGDVSLNYPVFIKPLSLGGGLGIDRASVAYDFASLAARVDTLSSRLQSDSLIEEYLPGREFSVAVLKLPHHDDYSAMPIELISQPNADGTSMLSHRVKTSNSETVMAVTDPQLMEQIGPFALDVFAALEARDYGRIDMRMDEAGRLNFLEANLIPSLIDNYGSFPKACWLNQNLTHESMVLRIAELGLARSYDAPSVNPISLLPLRLDNQVI